MFDIGYPLLNLVRILHEFPGAAEDIGVFYLGLFQTKTLFFNNTFNSDIK